MGKVVFGNRQKPGGVLIDAVDDAGAQLTVDAGQVIPQRVQQAVHQRVIGMARRRVHYQPLGLVDDQQIIVLVDDIQRHFLGRDVHSLRLGNLVGNGIANIQFVVFLTGLSVAGNQPFLNELLGGAAAQIRHAPGEKGVQPLPGNIGKQGHLFSFQKSLWNRNRCTISSTQPQVMKQSATLNTGKSIKVVSIISTTKPRRTRSIMLPSPPP